MKMKEEIHVQDAAMSMAMMESVLPAVADKNDCTRAYFTRRG